MQLLLSIIFWSVFALGVTRLFVYFIRAKHEFKVGYRNSKMSGMTPLEQIQYGRSLIEHYARGRRRWIKVGSFLHLKKIVRIAERDLANFQLLLDQLDAGEAAAKALEVPFSYAGTGFPLKKVVPVH